MAKETKPAKQETTAIVTYGEWTPEQMEKESSEMNSGGEFWKVPVGSSIVRFLPPKIGWPSPFVIRHQHFIEMPNMEHKIIFDCPRMHTKQPCMACGKADQMEASGSARDERIAKKLRPSKRVSANIVVGPKDPDKKPSIYAFGKTVYEQLKAIRESDEGGGNFLDPIKGFNIIIKRKGTGKDDTEYTLLGAREITQLANMEWIEMQFDLRKMIWVPTMEQQKRLFAGEDPKEVRGEAKEERRRASNRVNEADVVDADGNEVEPARTAEDDLFDDEVDVD